MYKLCYNNKVEFIQGGNIEMSETMNKKVLAANIADEFGLTKKDSEGIVNKLFDDIKDSLAKGNAVDIYGFGKFDIATRAAREGINPLTKERMTFSESKSAKFKSSKALKDAVNHR